MVEESHIGASAPLASDLSGQLFQPDGNWGAPRGDDRRHHRLSATPRRVGEGGDDSRSVAGHGDRDAAVVGRHWSTVIVGGYSLLTDCGHVQAAPRREPRVLVECGIDVFDTASIEVLIGRLERVFVTMTAELEQQA